MSGESAPCMSYYVCEEGKDDICFNSCNKQKYASDCGYYRLSGDDGSWDYVHEYCDLAQGECSEYRWDETYQKNVFVPGTCPTKCGEYYYNSEKDLCFEPCNARLHGDCGHYIIS